MQNPSTDLKESQQVRLSPERSARLYRILALLLLIAAAGIFGAIAEDVITNDPLTIIDARFSAWMQAHAVGSLTKCLLLITQLHSFVGVTVMTLAVSTYLWIKRLRIWVLRFMLTVFGGMCLNLLLKYVFMRQRPRFEHPLLMLTSYSFPSGHTLMATVFYGTVCALIVSRSNQWLWRMVVFAVTVVLILVVGLSRIYLGAHYLSDVLAAIAEGVAWLAFCFVLVEELKLRQKARAGKLSNSR
jgi:undecaprenyl-diphosphatase